MYLSHVTLYSAESGNSWIDFGKWKLNIRHCHIDIVDAVRFDVLTVMLLKIWVLWDVTWCHWWVSSSRCHEGSLLLSSVSSSSRRMDYLDCYTLNMELVCSYIMSGTTHTTARCHGPGDSTLQRHCCENISSHSLISLSASVVVEILVVYFGKIVRFDVLAVVTMEQWRLWSSWMWHHVVQKDATLWRDLLSA